VVQPTAYVPLRPDPRENGSTGVRPRVGIRTAFSLPTCSSNGQMISHRSFDGPESSATLVLASAPQNPAPYRPGFRPQPADPARSEFLSAKDSVQAKSGANLMIVEGMRHDLSHGAT
jgi:hypothetical protein